jgi:hypothetical protein
VKSTRTRQFENHLCSLDTGPRTALKGRGRWRRSSEKDEKVAISSSLHLKANPTALLNGAIWNLRGRFHPGFDAE